MSLEILQTLSKLAPNSYVFIFFVFFSVLLFFEKMNEFGVSLEILQTLSKLTPNSYVFILYALFVSILPVFFFEKEE